MLTIVDVPKKVSSKYVSDPMLILSYLVKQDPEYKALVRELYHTVILDNGVWENHVSEGIETLVQVAEDLPNVREIVIPDSFDNMLETRTLCEKALKFLVSNGITNLWRLMFVAQGKTVKEQLKQIQWALSIKEISTIGIPSHHQSPIDDIRDEAVLHTINVALFNNPFIDPKKKKKEWHILGAPYQPYVLRRWTRKYPWIRSIDSPLPYKLALLGIILNKRTTRVDVQKFKKQNPGFFKNYFDIKTDVSPRLVHYNIQMIKQWTQRTSGAKDYEFN